MSHTARLPQQRAEIKGNPKKNSREGEVNQQNSHTERKGYTSEES